MSTASSSTTAGAGARVLQEPLPGFIMPLDAARDDAAVFTHAVNVLHAATAHAGRAGLSSAGDYRLQLRRAMARVTEILDATSPTVSTERSLDDLRIDLQDLQVTSLGRDDRAVLLDAVTMLDVALQISLGDDAIGILLEATPVGQRLASLVFDNDPALLDPDSQITYLQACERLSNAACARRDAAVAAFAGANPVQTRYWVDGDQRALTDVRALEMQTALHWNPQYTHTRIGAARALQALPDTADAYACGLISQRTLDSIVDGAETLSDPVDAAIEIAIAGSCDPEQIDTLRQMRRDLLGSFDSKLAAFATQHNPLNVNGKIRSTLVQLDPAGAAARRVLAIHNQANVEFHALPDGLAQIVATMAADQALACMRRIDALAKQSASSDPVGLRRAQAFHRIITHDTSVAHAIAESRLDPGDGDTAVATSTTRSTPLRSTVGVHLDLVMDLRTFLGLQDSAADLIGVGPLPADAARELLADAAYVQVRRILTDPTTGHRLDTGVKRYVLTETEQQRIFNRDRYCRFPDCTRHATDCECDHAEPYEQGGSTSTHNLDES